MLACVTACSYAVRPPETLTSRIIPISSNAWAGSSVNVLAGVRQMIFTHGVHQYAAFYNAEGELVLAKRRLGEDAWRKQVTKFSGNVRAAHNHASLVVDGDGYLHVSWDQHNSALNYARSTEPGGLELEKVRMLGTNERSVTYPQFYRLPTGDLLFQYRDGGSGHGSLVMNAYSTRTREWRRLHDNLLDGEGEGSACWDMAVDEAGILHLAWIWRESPDVASNHDLYYLQSRDNGVTWQSVSGETQPLAVTIRSGRPVVRIPQNHKLMNPPIVAAGRDSRPFIASYWADSPTAKPRFRVLFYT
jgi:hypothetical protein